MMRLISLLLLFHNFKEKTMSDLATWRKFIANAGDDPFKQQLADIMSEALATLDSIPDEELERLVDCE